MRTANPALNQKTFTGYAPAVGADAMTLDGTVQKTAMLLFLCMAAASVTWNRFFTTHDPAAVMGLMMLGLIGGLIVAMVTIFKREWSAVTAPAYAGLEGLALGGLSATFEAQYPGIVIQAVGLTFGTLFALLAAYTSKLIQPSENFKLGIVAATGGIFIMYMMTFVLGIFGVNLGFIHGSGVIGIGLSLFIIVIAALNLVLDFDFIENGAATGAPKYMEWYGAFGLLVTLVWLYIEILHLLSKLRDRD